MNKRGCGMERSGWLSNLDTIPALAWRKYEKFYKIRSGSLFPDYCLEAGLPEYEERMLPKVFALVGCYAA
jgi:hypothetical protein